MLNIKIKTTNNLVDQLQKYTKRECNGKLEVQDLKGNKWTLYYYDGQIIWATGGVHPYRRWLRNISQNQLQINHDNIQVNLENTSIKCWDYYLLVDLYKQQKINNEQFHSFVKNTLSEVLFDLVQNLHKNPDKNINWEYDNFHFRPEIITEHPITSIDIDISLKHMQDTWGNWTEFGLAPFSPNLAPVLIQPDKLKQQVKPVVYKNLERLINGKYTLRDLAVQTQKSLLSITTSLLNYIYQGVVGFIEVNDLPFPAEEIKNKSTFTESKIAKNILVACIDDSPQIGQVIGQIVTSNRCKYIYIDNPLQALSTLIQNKPDLIFLDLIMPVMNGFELCSRLRKISLFANTPIVILTGNDGTFDQVKSKIYGATYFVKKPIVQTKILEILNKCNGHL